MKRTLFCSKKCSIWQIFLFLQNFKNKNWFVQYKIHLKWFTLAFSSKIFCGITNKAHFWPWKWLFKHFHVRLRPSFSLGCHFHSDIFFINFKFKSVPDIVKKHVVVKMVTLKNEFWPISLILLGQINWDLHWTFIKYCFLLFLINHIDFTVKKAKFD